MCESKGSTSIIRWINLGQFSRCLEEYQNQWICKNAWNELLIRLEQYLLQVTPTMNIYSVGICLVAIHYLLLYANQSHKTDKTVSCVLFVFMRRVLSFQSAHIRWICSVINLYCCLIAFYYCSWVWCDSFPPLIMSMFDLYCSLLSTNSK